MSMFTTGQDSLTPPPGPDRYGRTPGQGLLQVGFPSLWLVFLFFPVVEVISSGASLGRIILGLGGLGLFAGCYAASWWWTTPVPRWGLAANTTLWLAVMALTLCLTTPASPLALISVLPFFVARLAFALPFRQTLIALIPLLAISVALGWFLGPSASILLLVMWTGSCAIILGMVFLINREDRAKQVERELELSRQRESIGRDVHDLLGHSLTVITVKTELAAKLIDRDPARSSAELDEVLELAHTALGEVRATVANLRSPAWSAQLATTRSALRAAGIEAHLPPSDVVIPDPQRTLLAWCLREATTNVIRHAHATVCTIEASSGRLVVIDNGVGITDPTESLSRGNGLRGMTSRVEEVGGAVIIGPAHNASDSASSDEQSVEASGKSGPGTRVEVLLP